MAELDRDRILALSYISAKRRTAVEALWQLDLALGNALAGGREPLISQIKLAWWREALEALDAARPPAEPALRSAAQNLLPAGVSGAELAALEEGWAILLSPDFLQAEDLSRYAAARGGRLFHLSARLLGGEPLPEISRAGECWALIDLARHSADPQDSDAAATAARERLVSFKWPSRLRPLGMLATLADRDAARPRAQWEEPGSPRRMARMLMHRITGF